jgi:hypothetical protein
MEFLKSQVFFSFFVSIGYFIAKHLLRRIYKQEVDEDFNKKVMKDSVLIFVIVYLSFIIRENYFIVDAMKTQVFTSEPNF